MVLDDENGIYVFTNIAMDFDLVLELYIRTHPEQR